ncbi:polyadenylate-binding protein-interacting protein 3-like isoform X2 [Mangifera indica]|uniref:polyadenylate-binding protein-interacting protein 3-like isoform X2 n=1 Tax=Mangifera indica TaxID=29780 RepID=UPI001CFA3AE5|nr:polyadenylate-binding protein-interacting protein 3-like isoform X2 [Mangifera indica]
MMNSQQLVLPKVTANGFGRRRGEREGGTRLENKLPSGKSNSARVTSTGAMSGGKFGVYESPSHDRLLYVTTSLIGLPVDVQMKNGSIYSGIFHATSDEKEFGVILKMARLTKDGNNPRGQKAEIVSKAPSSIIVIPASELVQVIAKEVAVTRDGMASELQQEKQHEIMIDSFISQSRHADGERELEPWIPDEDDPRLPELENTFNVPWNRNWDQFETNKTLFGVKTTFNEELYTTKLLKGPQMRELEREAMRIAREIEAEDTQDLHLAEERGMNLHENFDIDEETRFSSVYRGSALDDSGYEEDEDIMLDSCNDETFGGSSGSVSQRPADLTSGKRSEAAQLSSSSSLVVKQEEAQSSHSGAAPQHSISYDHARQMASEIPHKSISTLDSETRVQENLLSEHGANNDVKEFLDKHLLAEDAQLSQSEDSDSLEGNIDGSDGVGLSANASSYAPSCAPSKSNEKTSSPCEQPEVPAPSKAPSEPQSINSHGRPGSSVSSNSECAVSASASSGPGLSPSSSVGSLSSERSTLNPHAREFKLNPYAKSFVPSQAAARPQSPVTDSPFYHPPNVSAVPHIPGMPVGFGPVMYNPQVAMQPPQAFYHLHGPQYGQQMVVSQPRPLFYMPTYQQPEMPYKGREF